MNNTTEKSSVDEKSALDEKFLSKQATMQHLTKMAPVDIEFSDITYSVPTGRKGMLILLPFIFIISIINECIVALRKFY